MPLDRFGRTIDYLRISLTDHCNLRCVYCMPLRGLQFSPREELLTAEEIERVVRAAVAVGFVKFRLTGGEPTLRGDLVEIVRRMRGVQGVQGVALTTNGMLLPDLAPPLRDAGLTRVNIHVDTLNPERLRHIMRFGEFEAIWAGIEAAQRVGFFADQAQLHRHARYNDADVVDLAR